MQGHLNVKSPNNTSKWQMGFNSAFKELIDTGREYMDWVHLRKKIHWQAVMNVAMNLLVTSRAHNSLTSSQSGTLSEGIV